MVWVKVVSVNWCRRVRLLAAAAVTSPALLTRAEEVGSVQDGCGFPTCLASTDPEGTLHARAPASYEQRRFRTPSRITACTATPPLRPCASLRPPAVRGLPRSPSPSRLITCSDTSLALYSLL